jgi:hypothetical protein
MAGHSRYASIDMAKTRFTLYTVPITAMMHFLRILERGLMLAASFASILIWVPNAMVFGRSVRKQAFMLAALCLPNFVYISIGGASLIALKAFDSHFIIMGSGFHRIVLIATAAPMLLSAFRTIKLTAQSRKFAQPVVAYMLVLALIFFVYALAARSFNATLLSADIFAVTGLLGIARAVATRNQDGLGAYDWSLANAGPAL